jgi:transposase
LHYAKPRPERPQRPEDAEEILDGRLTAALDKNKDDDPVTDGGFVVGFFDAAWPQPTDNSQRVWAVNVPRVERRLLQVDRPVLGFYALNGSSVAVFTEKQTKERICDAFEQIRAENPDRKILLILYNFSSHICDSTRERAAELGIELVFLPVGSPHLNPTEPLWKNLNGNSHRSR